MLGKGGKIRRIRKIRNLSKVINILYKLKEVILLHQNYLPIIDFSENLVSVDISVDYIEDKYQESQRQAEGGGVITPKNDPIIDFSFNT